MIKKLKIQVIIIALLLLVGLIVIVANKQINNQNDSLSGFFPDTPGEKVESLMSIDSLRARDYPASEIVIEETLEQGLNYKRFIASYKSDGYKIYGLLTIPNKERPEGGARKFAVG